MNKTRLTSAVSKFASHSCYGIGIMYCLCRTLCGKQLHHFHCMYITSPEMASNRENFNKCWCRSIHRTQKPCPLIMQRTCTSPTMINEVFCTLRNHISALCVKIAWIYTIKSEYSGPSYGPFLINCDTLWNWNEKWEFIVDISSALVSVWSALATPTYSYLWGMLLSGSRSSSVVDVSNPVKG